MTNKEMTELFALMLLAWPNAETFKGGIAKLGPTVRLWTCCAGDMDFRLGRQAVIRLCQKCRFPPTVADFMEQAAAVEKEIKARTDDTVLEIRMADLMYGSTDAFYRKMPPDSFTRRVIDIVGGPDALERSFTQGGETHTVWRLSEIEQACRRAALEEPFLEGRELPGG